MRPAQQRHDADAGELQVPPLVQAVEVPEAPVSVSLVIEEQIVAAVPTQEKKSASGKRRRNSKKN